ncbi:plasmid segregation centromere-binding protein ParR [Fischerella thermalis CCMEE 5268]|uniref:Plasmid segregation centromere-binding protein ParR n=1 Tax=Fischerella thermalis CCMEE 5268 TaxID=2019662 RepID=A0A2N6KG52_9CYAN|nr:plasmid segregation centromere-binding protein ParR [Fischerella thermalis CCMEE 5268]
MADESLLALIESQLEKDPNKTFSDLCKEALWQALCVPESVRPSPPPTPQPVPTQGVELQIAELQRQLADLEERFFAKESNRLEMMERHLTQLSQQVAQLAIMVHQTPATQSPTPSTAVSEVVNHTVTTTYTATPPQDIDPVISRLSQYLDDF